MPKLTNEEVETRLKELTNWTLRNDALTRDIEFKDFAASMAFVNKVAEVAEQANHHPDIDIRYNRLRLALITHSEGGITGKDADMAARIDKIG